MRLKPQSKGWDEMGRKLGRNEKGSRHEERQEPCFKERATGFEPATSSLGRFDDSFTQVNELSTSLTKPLETPQFCDIWGSVRGCGKDVWVTIRAVITSKWVEISTHSPGHLPGLTGLRGLAVLMVLVCHFVGGYFAPLGHLGVAVFFVLSGYVVAGSIDRAKERGTLAGVYLHRFARILPALGVLCLLCAWLAPGFVGRDLLSVITYTYNYAAIQHTTGTPHIIPVWSLCVEAHFYVLFPLLAWYLPPRALVGVLVAVVVVCYWHVFQMVYESWAASSYFASHKSVTDQVQNQVTDQVTTWVYFGTVSNLPTIAAGVILYHIRAVLEPGVCLRLASLVALACLLLPSMVRNQFPGGWDYFAGLVGLLQCAGGGVIAFLVAMYHEGRPGWAWVRELLRDRALAYVATVSYGVYIYHYFMLTVFPFSPWWALAWTAAAAVASFHLVEAPVCRMAKKFT